MSKTYIGAYNIVNPNLSYNQSSGSVNNPMTSDLDAGLNKIVNLANPADPGDAVNLSYMESIIPNTSGFIQNPLTSALNANNNTIANVASVTMKDAVQPLTTYSLVLENGALTTENASDPDSVLLHLAINEGGTSKPYYTDMRGFPITNLGTLGFLDGGIISKNSSSFQLNQPLDMNNNYIKDVQNIQFFNAPPLEIDLSNNLLYDDAIVVTANNIGGYISSANWEPSASSDLNMNTFNINLPSGDINLNSGQLVINEFPLGVDENNNLSFDKNPVLACKPHVFGTIPMLDSTPGSSVSIIELNPVMWSANAMYKSGFSDSPVFDIDLTMSLTENIPVNLETAQISIGLSNLQNPLNSTSFGQLLTYTGGFNQLPNGDLHVRFRTDEPSQHLVIIKSWLDACTSVGVQPFYMYIQASAQSVTNPNTTVIDVQSSTVTFSVLDPSDPFVVNEALNINENCKLQTYNITSPVMLKNGKVTINIFDYSQNSALLTSGSFYVKCMVVATNLCIKFSTFIFDNAVVSSSGSQTVIYSDASFESCILNLNAGVLSVDITMNSNLAITSMCKCKTKIMTTL